jgi:hypothetical protein
MPKGDLFKVSIGAGAAAVVKWKVRCGPALSYEVSAWADGVQEEAEKLLAGSTPAEAEYEIIRGPPNTAKVLRCGVVKVAPPAKARKKDEKEEQAQAKTAPLESAAILPCEVLQWECTKCKQFENNIASGPKLVKDCSHCGAKKTKPGKRVGSWKTTEKVERFRPDRWECPDMGTGSKCGCTTNTWLHDKSCKKCKADQQDAKSVERWIPRPGGLWVIPERPVPPAASATAYTVDALCALADVGFSASSPGKCPCCDKTLHGSGARVCFSVFYALKEAGTISAYRTAYRRTELQELLNAHGQCTCVFGTEQRALLALPNRSRTDAAFYMGGTEDNAREKYDRARGDAPEFSRGVADFSEQAKKRDLNMGCHVVPLVAGGCPTSFLTEAHLPAASSAVAASSVVAASAAGDSKERPLKRANIMPLRYMCPLCQALDVLLTDWQNEHAAILNGKPFDENAYMQAHLSSNTDEDDE